MKLTIDVLHGIYLGDICVSVYQKGKIREKSEVLTAYRELGANAVITVQKQKK